MTVGGELVEQDPAVFALPQMPALFRVGNQNFLGQLCQSWNRDVLHNNSANTSNGYRATIIPQLRFGNSMISSGVRIPQVQVFPKAQGILHFNR